MGSRINEIDPDTLVRESSTARRTGQCVLPTSLCIVLRKRMGRVFYFRSMRQNCARCRWCHFAGENQLALGDIARLVFRLRLRHLRHSYRRQPEPRRDEDGEAAEVEVQLHS